MKTLRAMLVRFAGLFRRTQHETEMNDELRAHLDALMERNVVAGMSLDEARHAALRAFGGVAQIQESARDERRSMWLEHGLKDLRFGARMLGKERTFTATAVLTLALCLAANLAIFAVVDAVLLRPLPFPESERLVTIFNSYPNAGIERYGTFVTSYYERRGHIPALSSLSLYRDGTAIVGELGAVRREEVLRVTPEFFATLGVRLARGRAFAEEEMTPGADAVAMVTEAFWRNELGAAPDVVGGTLRIDGAVRKIVGVLPADFRFLASNARIAVPLTSSAADRAALQRHGGTPANMIARLAGGATLAQAQAQIDAHNAAMERDNPNAKMVAETGFRSRVASLQGEHVAAIRPTLVLLQAGAFVLLLIGAVNVGNLLLIRTSARAKELAIRQSLGAGRRHVVVQVVTETTLLTTLGGLGALALGAWGIEALRVFGAAQLPTAVAPALELRTAGVALAASVALGIALSMPIVAHALRGRLADALQTQSRGGTTARATQRLRHAFIVVQIALAFTLLAGAGLLALSLKRTLSVSPGFRPDRVLTAQITVASKRYAKPAAIVDFGRKVLAEMERQPGVVAAGLVTSLPFGRINAKGGITIHGRTRAAGESLRAHNLYGVDGGYFAAMGIALKSGRLLTSDDGKRADLVCVVDEDFARAYFAGGEALGRRIALGSEEKPEQECFRIIGVVAPVKHTALTDSPGVGAVYFPFQNLADSEFYFAIRTQRTPESAAPLLQRVVRLIDPEVPVSDLRAIEERIHASMTARRGSAWLIGLFSGVAVLLCAVGTYGVLSFAVAQRAREIAIRVALGARPGQIRDGLLSLNLRLLLVGLVLGGAGAWAAGRAMQGLLFGVPPLHLASLAAAAALVSITSFAACALPARRAAKIDPMTALRAE